ncbi:hypothetical protein K9M79_00700 [Candidatus Woesearchaeota archaeon]|nr:hypothetical protein [Candidatus Woesearchaeota archaeon]
MKYIMDCILAIMTILLLVGCQSSDDITNQSDCVPKCIESGKTPGDCIKQCETLQNISEDRHGESNKPTQIKESQDALGNDQTQQKCGDGVCDQIEKANNVCPKDCSGELPGTEQQNENQPNANQPGINPKEKDTSGNIQPGVDQSGVQYPSDKPDIETDYDFPDIQYTNDGLFAFSLGTDPADEEKNMDVASELDADWVRISGPTGLVWGHVEKEKGIYDWTQIDPYVSIPYSKGLKVLMTVLVVNEYYGVEYGYKPTDMEAYKKFIQAAAERYDGDGINDAPGSPVVSVWQIGNECDLNGCAGGLADYAEILKASFEAIKLANEDIKVAISGISGPPGLQDYSQLLDSMDSQYFDIFDIHWHSSQGGNYLTHPIHPNKDDDFTDYIAGTINLLKKHNFKISDIWITEMSTSDRSPTTQTEEIQAIDLVKRYVYSASKGIDAIFWGSLYDQPWKNSDTNYFATIGLIGPDGNQKMAYDSYRIMVENLKGTKSVKTVYEGDVNIYQIDTEKGYVWVVWADSSPQETDLSLNDLTGEITIINSITGEETQNNLSGSFLSLTLGEEPVYIFQ